MGAIVVYSVTDRESFKRTPGWLAEVKEYSDPQCSIILVANKMDIEEEKRQVTHLEGKIMAERFKVNFWEVSGLHQTNVANAFEDLAA